MHLTWVTGRNPSIFAGRLAPLVAGLIDEVHERTGLGDGLLKPIPRHLRGPYHAVVCTESRILSALKLGRIPSRTYVAPALRFRLSSVAPSGSTTGMTVFERFRAMMELAIGHVLDVRTQIEVPSALEADAARRLPDGVPYVGLSPGAGGISKRWPLEKFMQLAQRFMARGAVPVFFLGPEEAEFRTKIQERLPGVVFPEYGDGTAAEQSPLFTVALARRLVFSVANDSGGGHLVAAGGRPLLTLYGHTNATKFKSPYCDHHSLTASEVGYKTLDDLPTELVEARAVELRLEALLAGAARRISPSR